MKIEITLNEPGALRKLVSERKAEFKNADLKVVGRMNEADLKFIKQATGRNGFIKGIDLTFASGLEQIDRNTFEEGGTLNSFRFPSSVRKLGWGAFCMCENLGSITMISDIESIENYAFNGCLNLPSITLPKNLKYIGSETFFGCSKLEEFKIATTNRNFKTVDGVLLDKGGKCILKFPAGKSEKDYVFPSTLKTIGDHAFFLCDKIRHIILPEGVESIGKFAFASCTSIQTVTLPSSLKRIDENAFSNCDSLMTFNIKATTPPTLHPDSRLAETVSFYVPLSSVDAYRKADGWKDIKNIFGK